MNQNFLRTLKYSWAYRRRFLASIICAGAVAALWSLNLSAIYPVLKILSTDKNLQQWIDDEIDDLQAKLDDPQRLRRLAELRGHLKAIEGNESHPDRDNMTRKLTGDISTIEADLAHYGTWVYNYQLLKTKVICHLPTDRFETFFWIIVGVVAGVALKGVFEFCQESLVGSVANRTLFDLRNHFFRRVLHHDVRQMGETGTTELMARFTNDTEQLGNGIKVLYGRMVVEPLKALGCLVVACYISWQLTLLFILLVPLALVTLMKASRMMRKAARRMLQQMSDIYKILRETFDGFRVVKAFTMESRERRRFRKATDDYYHRAMRVINIDAIANPVIELLGVIAVGIALSAGTYLVVTGKTHVLGVRMASQPLGFATLLQLYAFLAAIADPVRKLSSVYTKLQGAEAAANRVFELFDRTPTVRANADGPRVGRVSKGVEFRNVCFSYDPARPTLANVHLTVAAGETVAVVGPNGCGKSTLVGLIPRFYDPDHGAVLIDGVNVRGAHLRSLRRQVAIVAQDTRLFDDTILANIAYGRRDATPFEVAAAACKADIHRFIVSLPDGYGTRVGDMGAPKLSGGQQQKIALARAILRDPSVLILDEFTSAADAESESVIFQDIREFVKGRTTFLITHRLHTLEIADRIVVMNEGQIIAVGRHADLLATCDLYQRLCSAQQLRIAA